MSKEWTGILLDPDREIIKKVTVPHDGIAAMLGCRFFTVVRLDAKHDAFVDDEWMLKPFGPMVTVVKDYPNPLAGKVLVLCHDGEGETLSCEWTEEQVRERLTFGVIAKLHDKLVSISDFGIQHIAMEVGGGE